MTKLALHEDLGRDDGVRIGSDRNFGCVIAVALTLVSALARYHGHSYWHWLIWVAVAFAAAGLLYPAVLHPLNSIWFRFGLWLARIVQPVVLGILFYAVVTPFALIYRLFVRRPLGVGADASSRSTWIKRSGQRDTDDFKNQF